MFARDGGGVAGLLTGPIRREMKQRTELVLGEIKKLRESQDRLTQAINSLQSKPQGLTDAGAAEWSNNARTLTNSMDIWIKTVTENLHLLG